MTLIVYSNKTLFADSKVVQDVKSENLLILDTPKLFISKCKRFAYANAGTIFDSRERNVFEIFITKHFQQDCLGINDIQVPKEIVNWIFKSKHHNIVVMTSRNVYNLEVTGGIRLNYEHLSSYGSGSNLFDFAYAITPGVKTIPMVKKIYEDVSKISKLSGPLHTYVKMVDLIPFK